MILCKRFQFSVSKIKCQVLFRMSEVKTKEKGEKRKRPKGAQDPNHTDVDCTNSELKLWLVKGMVRVNSETRVISEMLPGILFQVLSGVNLTQKLRWLSPIFRHVTLLRNNYVISPKSYVFFSRTS